MTFVFLKPTNKDKPATLTSYEHFGVRLCSIERVFYVYWHSTLIHVLVCLHWKWNVSPASSWEEWRWEASQTYSVPCPEHRLHTIWTHQSWHNCHTMLPWACWSKLRSLLMCKRVKGNLYQKICDLQLLQNNVVWYHLWITILNSLCLTTIITLLNVCVSGYLCG